MKSLLLFIALLSFPLSQRATQNSLEETWRSTAAAASGRVGVAALVIGGAEHASVNGSEHFPAQSVYKLPIAMAVFRLIDQRKLSLEQAVDISPKEYPDTDKHSPLRDQNPKGARKTIRELLQYAIVESDGAASDVLLRLAGGPTAVTQYVRSLGIKELVVAGSERNMTWKSQYDNWCSPEAAVQLLTALEKGGALSEPGKTLLLKYMHDTQTGANRIRRLLPSGTLVADKTGSSGTERGLAAATNDIAVITLPDGREVAMAVFVSDSTASDETRDDVIAKIARETWDEWDRAK